MVPAIGYEFDPSEFDCARIFRRLRVEGFQDLERIVKGITKFVIVLVGLRKPCARGENEM